MGASARLRHRCRSCLLPARPYGAIIRQTTVIFGRRRRMSLGPGDSEPSQFRGDVAAGPAPLVLAGKASIQDKSSQVKLSGVKSGQAYSSPGTASPIFACQVTFD